MSNTIDIQERKLLIDLNKLTDGEKFEMRKLGILSDENSITPSVYPTIHNERPPIEKHVVHASPVTSTAGLPLQSVTARKSLIWAKAGINCCARSLICSS